MRQEDEMIDLSKNPAHEVDHRVPLEQGLKPRAVVQHCEELEKDLSSLESFLGIKQGCRKITKENVHT